MLLIKPQVTNSLRNVFFSKAFPWFMLVLLLTFTTGLWHYSESVFVHMSLDRFKMRVENQNNLIVNHLHTYKLVLQSTSVLLSTGEAFHQVNWSTYISELKKDKFLPGFKSVGFIPASVSGDPMLEKQLTYDKTELINIFMQAKNTAAFTLSSDLLNRENNQTEFILILPVYQKHISLPLIEGHHDLPSGFLYISFQLTPLIQEISHDNDQDIAIEIFDKTAGSEKLIFSSRNNLTTSRYASRKELVIGGRIWVVYFLSKPHFDESTISLIPSMIRFGGLGFSLLLFSLLLWNIEQRERLQAIRKASDTSH